MLEQATMSHFQQHPDDLIKKVNRKVEEPPKVEPAEEAKQEESLKELKKQLPSILFGDKPAEEKPKEEAAKPGEKPNEEAAKPGEKPNEEAKKPVEEKPKEEPKVPSALEIATAAATEAVKAVADRLPQPAPEKPAAPEKPVVEDAVPEHFSEADKETYELFKVLSETEPSRYKGKHKEFAEFVDKLAVYRRRWEKANPGDTFDPDDDAHSTFYDANQPVYSDADLNKARIRREASVEVARQVAATKAEYEAKLKEIENKTVGAEVSREAQRVAGTATSQFIQQLPDDTMKAAAKDPAALKESDPLAFEVLNTAAAQLQQQVIELHSIANRPGYFNPNNPVHSGIAQFVSQQENLIKGLPAAQQVFEGRTFATRAEYAALTAAQRASRWVLTEDDVVHMLTQSSAVRAVKSLEAERSRIESMAVKYGFKKDAASQKTPAQEAAAAQTAAKPNKPAAPSGSPGDAAPPLGKPAKVEDASVEKKLVSALW